VKLKLLVILMTFALFVGIIGFVVTNLTTKVEVTVFKTTYKELPLFMVVILGVFAGICYAGIIGVAEGAQIRLANRRLVRELTRLETELTYARTVPTEAPRPEPDVVHEVAPAAAGPLAPVPEPSVATAPVYGTEEDWGPDDDDAYSGGRAV
jgi:uncharacterized integral membrane protein